MYIWVLLATFLAVLASYTLSVRPDMRELSVTRVAEASLSRMIVQHEAGITYVKYNKYPYLENYNEVGYSPGIISDDDLLNEMPYGYVLDDSYTSQIFCMNEDLTVAYASGGGGNPCDVPGRRKMLVTYGPIPTRWMNLSAAVQRPNADFLDALWSTVASRNEFGYMISAKPENVHVSRENPSASNVQLATRSEEELVFVPKAVLQDSSFKKVCNLAENHVCLVYMTGI